MAKYYFLIGCVLCGLCGRSQALIITEIMYDPPVSCPEYLEITNIEISNARWDELWIQKSTGQPVRLTLPGNWPSGESRVITPDKEKFSNCYKEVDTALVYEVDLFALTNTGTTLTLKATNSGNQTIDQVNYSPSDHNEMFTNTRGVALERNIHEPQNNKWRSGFVQFGYRSPGFLPEWDEMQEVEVIFSTSKIYSQANREPSSLEIKIESEGVDGSVTIEIYDINGKRVRTLANAVPLQGGELFTWKGRSKTGQLLPEGLYLFWIYYFDVMGRKRIFKKTCVLSNT